MATNYIFSTLANDQIYQDWASGGGDMPVPGNRVFIKGGTGVANDRLITPLGVMTEVNDNELALLEANHTFQAHKRAGFITVQKKRADPEKVAADMKLNDPSSPKTPADYEGGEVKVVAA